MYIHYGSISALASVRRSVQYGNDALHLDGVSW